MRGGAAVFALCVTCEACDRMSAACVRVCVCVCVSVCVWAPYSPSSNNVFSAILTILYLPAADFRKFSFPASGIT